MNTAAFILGFWIGLGGTWVLINFIKKCVEESRKL
jgi:hypothetical protein